MDFKGFKWFCTIGCLVLISGVSSANITKREDMRLKYSTSETVRCEEAKIRCALRQGCNTALQSYTMDCAELMTGKVEVCDDYCKSALVALLSSDEGSSLMNCECRNDFCRETKSRIDVCRDEVLEATASGSILPCSMAHLICLADSQCSLALSFYETHCARMFRGKSCSPSCNNSISVLRRQQQAYRLETCECDSTEPFDCKGIKKNMAELCFHTYHSEEEIQAEKENEVNNNDIEDIMNVSKCSYMENNKFLLGILISAVVRWNI